MAEVGGGQVRGSEGRGDISSETGFYRESPQEIQGKAVERRDGDTWSIREIAAKAFAHLIGGLIGKGEDNDLMSRYV